MDYIEVTDEMMDEYWCVREESVSNEIARDAIRAAIAASPLYKRVQELEAELAKRQWQGIESLDPTQPCLLACRRPTSFVYSVHHFSPRADEDTDHAMRRVMDSYYAVGWRPLPEPPKGETK